jgi:hypothetical protein
VRLLRVVAGGRPDAAYTPTMRRLVCIAALLTRFAGQGYIWRAGPLPRPVPIVRDLALDTPSGTLPAWWMAR